MLDANIQSFKNLEENLAEMGLTLDEMPLVLQYNKRDLADICSPAELDEALNRNGWPSFEAVAIHGQGVFETLKGISRATLMTLRQRLTTGTSEPQRPVATPATPAGAAPKPGATFTEPASQAGAAKAERSSAPSTEAAAAQARTARPPAAPSPPSEPPSPPRGPAAAAGAGETPASRPMRRTVDVDGELARLRREALRKRSDGPAAARAAASTNGKRELSRDIKLTLKRPDFERARRFTLSFQVEDESREIVDSVKGLQVDLGTPGDLAKVLLRLNIALQAKE